MSSIMYFLSNHLTFIYFIKNIEIKVIIFPSFRMVRQIFYYFGPLLYVFFLILRFETDKFSENNWFTYTYVNPLSKLAGWGVLLTPNHGKKHLKFAKVKLYAH